MQDLAILEPYGTGKISDDRSHHEVGDIHGSFAVN